MAMSKSTKSDMKGKRNMDSTNSEVIVEQLADVRGESTTVTTADPHITVGDVTETATPDVDNGFHMHIKMEHARWMRAKFEGNTGEVLPLNFEQQCCSMQTQYQRKEFTFLETVGFNWIEALHFVKQSRLNSFILKLKPDETELNLFPCDEESEERVAQLVSFGFTEEEALKWSHQPIIPDHMLEDNTKPINVIPIRIAPTDFPNVRFTRRESAEIVTFIAECLKQETSTYAVSIGTRFFVRGYLLIPCFRKFAVDWLEQKIPTCGRQIMIISKQVIHDDIPCDEDKCKDNYSVKLRANILKTTGDILSINLNDLFQNMEEMKQFRQLLNRGYNWIEALHYGKSHNTCGTIMAMSESEIEAVPWVGANIPKSRLTWWLTNGFTRKESLRLGSQSYVPDTGLTGVNKKAKPIPVRIVPASYPKTLLFRTQAAAAIEAIHSEVKKDKDANPTLHFGTKFFIDGYILIPCSNQPTVEWMERIVPMLEFPLRVITLLELEAAQAKLAGPPKLNRSLDRRASSSNKPCGSGSRSNGGNQFFSRNVDRLEPKIHIMAEHNDLRGHGFLKRTNNIVENNGKQVFPCVPFNRLAPATNKTNNPYVHDLAVNSNITQHPGPFKNSGQASRQGGYCPSDTVFGHLNTVAGSGADEYRFESDYGRNQFNQGNLNNRREMISDVGSHQRGPIERDFARFGGNIVDRYALDRYRGSDVGNNSTLNYNFIGNETEYVSHRSESNIDNNFSGDRDLFTRRSCNIGGSSMAGNQFNNPYNQDWSARSDRYGGNRYHPYDQGRGSGGNNSRTNTACYENDFILRRQVANSVYNSDGNIGNHRLANVEHNSLPHGYDFVHYRNADKFHNDESSFDPYKTRFTNDRSSFGGFYPSI